MLKFECASRSFEIRPLPALACLVVIALTLSAARWQTARAHYKQSLSDAYQANQNAPVRVLSPGTPDMPDEFSRVSLTGHWRSDWLIYADNQVRSGRPGFAIFMPLCAASGCVLVSRGWLPQRTRRDELPPVKTPTDEVTVEGRVGNGRPRFVELSPESMQGRVWQNVTVDRVAAVSGLVLSPFIVVRSDPSDDGLLRDTAEPDFGIDKHWMYAVQWYGFAIVTLVFGLYAAMRKKGGSA
ncbi:SURF1 family protein [Methyloversatilis thermotolerans]|uniref:SURF1 family protein n=1 Tax=Methyloversatilis thermotolerans TaxID=1346290 RepID=UPI00037F0B52|nr:SURF1 family protein [Methyloversatilis thermotolerans]